MKHIKNEKGITLVSLIITIIVLGILATVTIRNISDGEIIDETKTIKNSYEEMATNEEQQLQVLKQEVLGE